MKKEKAKAKKEKRRNKNRNKNTTGSGDKNEDPASDIEQPDKEIECNPDQQVSESKPETDEAKPIDLPDPDLKEDSKEDLADPDECPALEIPVEPGLDGDQGGPQIDEQAARDLTPEVVVELKPEVNECDQLDIKNVMIIEDQIVDNVVDDVTTLIETKLSLSDEEESKIKKELEENEKKIHPAKKKLPNKPVKSNQKSAKSKKGKKNGSEEEDEDDGYSEEAEDDWEWDYGEQWNEKEGGEGKEKENLDPDSDYLEVNDLDDKPVEEPQV